jgi:hypothetical protein
MTGTATMRVGQFGRPTLSKDSRTITVHIRSNCATRADANRW